MPFSTKDLEPAFQGAGQKAGMEIWRIENFHPTLVPNSSHGKFYMGDSYIILKTTALKSGALRNDIHYWLGKDTSEDEAGTAAIKTVELDAVLGGRAVQYREVQGHETEKFLSYFKPCIIPLKGGVASGFNHPDVEEHETRLYVCKGKHSVHVKEVPIARSSLNHDDVFILDTKSKIFQFNGSNSSIQERAKSLEVVQFIKDTYHDGKCEVASVEDGKLMADAEAGEFWTVFGGFAPLPRKVAIDNKDSKHEDFSLKLFCIEKGQAEPVEFDSLKGEVLDTNKSYLLDCGLEVFVWMGKSTSLDDKKSASKAAEDMLSGSDRPNAHIVRVAEGYETVMFRSKFDNWPQRVDAATPEEGRGKVAALLKRQGLNVKGLLKSDSDKEEQPEAYIDCTGNLQVWHVSGQRKTLTPSSEQSKFYSGDCYIFEYAYPGEDKEEYLIGTWFGKQSVEQERTVAISLASKMVESMKMQPVQARIFEGMEPIQFLSIFQSFIVFKGGLSSGYKNSLVEKELQDDTYTEEDGIALFRVQGSGPDNMQAIQVEPVASSLNSSYCYILKSDSIVFTWSGSLTTPEDLDLAERQLDMIKPNVQSRPQKDGAEIEQFWELLGGKREYSRQKIAKVAESDLHLFSCTFFRDQLKVTEIFNFTQDDLMTEDTFILDCHSTIFVWTGQQVERKSRIEALIIAEKFLEHDFLLERLSQETPIFIVMEGSEPTFFTRFFTWDSAKVAMHGNSFQRKLAMVKNGVTPTVDKPKRRVPKSYGGRTGVHGVQEKSKRSRSMTFSPDRVRVRGRSPAFNALAANFENTNRNLSMPPPMISKLYPKSGTSSPAQLVPKSAAIAALTASFEPSWKKESSEVDRSKLEASTENSNSTSDGIESLTIQEDAKEGETEEDDGLPIYPYERLTVTSTDPSTEIDVTKREAYLSSEEFREKFDMTKDAFYKLPKWKQTKLKMAIELF